MTSFLRIFDTTPSHTAKYKAHVSKNSAAWRRTKAAVRARSGGRCEAFGCRVRKNLSVHHRTYKRLGHERMSDLEHLCPYHHRKADNRRRRHAWLMALFGR